MSDSRVMKIRGGVVAARTDLLAQLHRILSVFHGVFCCGIGGNTVMLACQDGQSQY